MSRFVAVNLVFEHDRLVDVDLGDATLNLETLSGWVSAASTKDSVTLGSRRRDRRGLELG